MSDVEWDADDYVPPPPVIARAVTDKWEGEDEEDVVKESWEDDEEKKDDDSSPTSTATAKKKKKKLGEILAEKEKKKQDEMERKFKEKDEEMKNNTPEEILAEKLRIQKIQEDSDFQIATELMGEKSEPTSLDAFDLSTSSGLDRFRLTLLKKIKNIDRLESKPFFVSFLEDLCRGLCENLELDDIKKVTTVLNALYNEKVKASKPSKGKKKGASKAKLNLGQGVIADHADTMNAFDYDDYDDFI